MTLWFWGAFVLGAFWPDTLPEPGDERSRWVQFLFARAAHNFTDLKQTDATRGSTPWSTALASPVWRNLAAAQSVLELKERPFVTLYYSREPTESQSFILWSILPKPASDTVTVVYSKGYQLQRNHPLGGFLSFKRNWNHIHWQISTVGILIF